MEPLIAIVLALLGYALGSAKIINEGNEALSRTLRAISSQTYARS